LFPGPSDAFEVHLGARTCRLLRGCAALSCVDRKTHRARVSARKSYSK
jgi:hypothetical protein